MKHIQRNHLENLTPKRTKQLEFWSDYKTRKEFYKTPEWKRLRALVYKIFRNPKCMAYKSTKNLNIDHVRPVKHYPWLMRDLTNLQILCSRCNKEKCNKTIDFRSKWDRKKIAQYIGIKKLPIISESEVNLIKIKEIQKPQKRIKQKKNKKPYKGRVGLVKTTKKTILVKRSAL